MALRLLVKKLRGKGHSPTSRTSGSCSDSTTHPVSDVHHRKCCGSEGPQTKKNEFLSVEELSPKGHAGLFCERASNHILAHAVLLQSATWFCITSHELCLQAILRLSALFLFSASLLRRSAPQCQLLWHSAALRAIKRAKSLIAYSAQPNDIFLIKFQNKMCFRQSCRQRNK